MVRMILTPMSKLTIQAILQHGKSYIYEIIIEQDTPNKIADIVKKKIIVSG